MIYGGKQNTLTKTAHVNTCTLSHMPVKKTTNYKRTIYQRRIMWICFAYSAHKICKFSHLICNYRCFIDSFEVNVIACTSRPHRVYRQFKRVERTAGYSLTLYTQPIDSSITGGACIMFRLFFASLEICIHALIARSDGYTVVIAYLFADFKWGT